LVKFRNGQRFCVLPYKTINSKAIPKLPVDESNVEYTKSKTVLIAEDEDSNFILIKKLFEDLEINTIRAINGVEAVAFCKENPEVDLILMDLRMPEMDGFEATKRIKAFRPDLAIIAQTAFATDTDKDKALACGCSDYISKPFKKEVLLSKVSEQILN